MPSVTDYLKPGFPIDSNNGDSDSLRLEYIGDKTALEGYRPNYGDTWETYDGRVSMSEIQPTENPDIVTLVVEVSSPPDLAESTTGEAQEISYEIEWVPVSRNMLEHPEFRVGGEGAHKLAVYDVTDIEYWRNELKADLKQVFKYARSLEGGGTYVAELSGSAKLFATGILQGIEEYSDYAPVLRKTTTLIGGPGATSEAGQKDEPAVFPGKPIGYEWLKTADRSVTQGGRKRWQKIEEWTGAKKVLVDKDEIFWTTA
jgi:hypothetical protein